LSGYTLTITDDQNLIDNFNKTINSVMQGEYQDAYATLVDEGGMNLDPGNSTIVFYLD